jgi:hypothetical protein
MPRQTFILTQDIASGQLDDAHPKAGTNLQKLVDKKVIDTLIVSNVSTSGISTRLDLALLDQPLAVGPTDIGILTSKQHALFINGTDNGVQDPYGEEVRGNITSQASVLDPVGMTIGMATGVAATPALFAVGDLVRIQGQSLTGTFFAEISNIAGPVLTFVDVGTANPRIFIEAGTGTYFMERVRRWTMTWVDSLGAVFSLPVNIYAIGVVRRSYLADIGEDVGWVVLPVESESPHVPGGGGGGLFDKVYQATMVTANATPTTIILKPLNDGDVCIFQGAAVAHRADGTIRASYMRTARAHRQGGGAVLGIVQADYTDGVGLDLLFAVSGNDVLLQVQGELAQNYAWAAKLGVLSLPPIGNPTATSIASFQQDSFVALAAQTAFTLTTSFYPNGLSILIVNGVVYAQGADYVISGTALTWLNTPFTFIGGESVVVKYQIT